MSVLKLPGLLDLVRITRGSRLETEKAFRAYYASKPPFNYNTARSVTRGFYSGDLSLAQGLHACHQRGSPIGRPFNAQVVEAIFPVTTERNVLCFDVPGQLFSVRADMHFWVRPLCGFSENRIPYLLFLQPRKLFDLTHVQLGMLASIIKLSLIRDDFSGANIELLDVSCRDGELKRSCDIYRLEDLPILAEEELHAEFEKFANAYDRLIEGGLGDRDTTRPDENPENQMPLIW
jgi:hypothetical protein